MPRNIVPVLFMATIGLFPMLTSPKMTSVLLNHSTASAMEPVTIELAIVCDKDFGDVFQHDRQRILEYWTVFIADVSLRLRSLPSSDISIRVTSVTVISSVKEQPFIESVRGTDGKIKLIPVIAQFAKWTYKKTDALPKFDVIMGVTGASLKGTVVGASYFRGVCSVEHVNDVGILLSSAVIADKGTWSVTSAAHELGHLLGARHDADVKGCNQTGFIMSGATPDKQYFFSSCSDKAISDYLKTDQAACLKRLDNVNIGNIDVLPLVPNVRPPSMQEQCQRLASKENVSLRKKSSCQIVKCTLIDEEGKTTVWNHFPVDGTPCEFRYEEMGNCFWGECFPQGFFLVNKASGQCLSDQSTFSMSDHPVMSPCPRSPTPLNKFYNLPGGESRQLNFLYTPALLQNASGIEGSVKCVQVGETQNDSSTASLSFKQCLENGGSTFEWRQVDELHGNLILSNGISSSSQYCIGYGATLSSLVGYRNCVRNDPKVLWKRSAILESKGIGSDAEDQVVGVNGNDGNDNDLKWMDEPFIPILILFLLLLLYCAIVVMGLACATITICWLRKKPSPKNSTTIELTAYQSSV